MNSNLGKCAEVIKLSDFKPLRAAPAIQSVIEYYCTKCQGDMFTLKSDGQVVCAHCRTRMTNLRILFCS